MKSIYIMAGPNFTFLNNFSLTFAFYVIAKNKMVI